MNSNRRGTLAIATIIFSLACWAQSYTITTAAGGANPGYLPGTGDGGSAASAGLGKPCNDVAVDGAGNLYIAAGSLIRKISNGVISTLAGGGVELGDGIPATQAELAPLAIAADVAGDLYIADTAFGISRIRRVDANGIITTVAGGAQCCALGDGGPATGAYLELPYGLALDAAGNIYIAQTGAGGYNLIREVSAAGIISTVAGGGPCCNLGDGGPATSTSLCGPTGVAVDSAGTIYVVEAGGNRIRNVSGGIIKTVASIDSPWHISLDPGGNLYVTQINDATVSLVSASGAATTIAGDGTHGFSGDGGPATSAEMDRPAGIAVNGQGAVYIADATSGIARVRLLTPRTSGPSITSGGVVSASAFGQFHTIAPGTWIEIYGANLATDSRGWAGSDFNGVNAPTSLDGTSVTIGGQSAFIDYISPQQVNALVPSNVGTGSQSLIVTTANGASSAYTVTVNATQPGLFAPQSFNVGGKQYAGALFSDGMTFAIPPGAIAGVPSRRAQPGDNITLYGIGFGSVAPNTLAGEIVPAVNSLTLPFNLSIGGTQAQVTYDGLAPGAVGLYQFNAVVPSIPGSDTTPLTFTLGGAAGSQTLYIAVQ